MDQIKEAVLIGKVAGTPYPPCQVVILAYNVLNQTGVFEDKCKVWQKNPGNQCMCATMKQKFGNSYHDILVNPTTNTGADYHNANAANITTAKDYSCGHAEALENHATVTKCYCATVHELVNSNSSLTTQLATVENWSSCSQPPGLSCHEY